MTRQIPDSDLPMIGTSEFGLEDRSEEIEEQSEKDVRIKFYGAMASIDDRRPDLARHLCQAIAPVLYDFCAIYVRRPNGELELEAACDANPALSVGVEELIRVSSMLSSEFLERAATHGETVSSSVRGPCAIVDVGEHCHRIEVHSVLATPLMTGRGKVFGALCLGRHATSREYDEIDRALLQWIASHVATKLEASRLQQDLRATNEALRRKTEALEEALEARDVFIASASHELKTPLTTAALQIEILQRNLAELLGDDAQLFSKNVGSLERQIQRLNDLASKLLNVHRLKDHDDLHLDIENVDLGEVTREVSDRFAHVAARQRMHITCQTHEVNGIWDRCRLDQILTNLISNAVKYGDEMIGIRAYPDGEFAVIEVEDDGPGFCEETRERLFRRFERGEDAGNKPGLGIGLWIVARLVERFDGEIEVDSTPETGTTFRIRLPRNTAAIVRHTA